MIKITPEEIYQYYHRQYIYKSKGIYPKQIKNFEKIKNNRKWIYFKRFADSINRGYGQINYKFYIDSLIEFFNGYFDLKLLGHPKGFKIYKNYISLKEEINNEEKLEKIILENIKFVIQYCKENCINNIEDYFFENQYTLPTIVKHYNSKSISKYFLCMIPNIITIIKSFPKDVIDDYMKEFFNEYNSCKNFITLNIKLRKIRDNIYQILNKKIKEANKKEIENKNIKRRNNRKITENNIILKKEH